MTSIVRQLAILVLLGGGAATAQDSPEQEKPFEVFAGYSYLHEDGHNFNGWTGTFVAEINKWFGLAADFDGHYRSATEEGAHVSEHEHGFTFGPHVSFHNKRRVTPFAFALFGGAHASASVDGHTASTTGFAMNLGGGLDVRLNEWIDARIVQVDAAYTRFDGNGTTSPRVSAGLVFHFGK